MKSLSAENANKVSGGAKTLGGAKFNVGDKVMSKAHPDGGVGTVVKSQYDKGWWYDVRMQGGNLHTPESDLQPALLTTN